MTRARRRSFDEENVLQELSQELGEEIDEDRISEEDFYGERVFRVDLGQREYVVFKDDDSAEEAAYQYVKESLENEPKLFNQDWLESHIDMDALREWVYEAVMEDDYAYELANDDPERFWEEAEYWGIDVPDNVQAALDEGEDPGKVPDDVIEELKEAIAKDRSKEPMQWLEDIYGREDAVKKAMEVAGIDVEEAAREAVRTDGWPHFISNYDGNYTETNSNFVFFRAKMIQRASKARRTKGNLKTKLLR